jgi:hypothetical protein
LHCKDTLLPILFTHLLNFWCIEKIFSVTINCNL